MALKKQIALDSGLTADYVKLADNPISYWQGRMSIAYEAYASHEFRLNGKAPAIKANENNIDLSLIALTDIVLGNDKATGYNILKKQPSWADAEDIIDPVPVEPIP